MTGDWDNRDRVIAEQAREIGRLRTELDRAFEIAGQALADHCRWLRERVERVATEGK